MSFKYQPGDVLVEVRLLPLGTPEQLEVVRTAIKGESVEGQWINGPRTIIVSYDSYILRDKEGHDFYGSREHMENSSFFTLVANKSTQQPAAPAGMNAVCPHCQSPAYQGLFRLECSKNCKGE